MGHFLGLMGVLTCTVQISTGRNALWVAHVSQPALLASLPYNHPKANAKELATCVTDLSQGGAPLPALAACLICSLTGREPQHKEPSASPG